MLAAYEHGWLCFMWNQTSKMKVQNIDISSQTRRREVKAVSAECQESSEDGENTSHIRCVFPGTNTWAAIEPNRAQTGALLMQYMKLSHPAYQHPEVAPSGAGCSKVPGLWRQRSTIKVSIHSTCMLTTGDTHARHACSTTVNCGATCMLSGACFEWCLSSVTKHLESEH